MELTQEYLAHQLKNLATKDDLKNLASKDDLLELATRSDITSVKENLSEINEVVNRIDKRTDEDHRAAVHDVEDLKTRVTHLERTVPQS